MTIESIVRGINRELVPVFEEKLRAALVDRDREWLIDQVVRLTLDAQALNEADRRTAAEAKTRARRERHERVSAMAFDAARLAAFIEEHEGVTRESLVAAAHLLPEAPAKGTALLAAADRTDSGEELLTHAKDVLFALLFADESMGCDLAAAHPGAAHPRRAPVQGRRARLHARLDRARRRRHLAGPRERVERRARRQRPAGGAVRRDRGRAGRPRHRARAHR